jgi:putative component of toxin-antitoxin plasmid stabilization module
LQDPNHELGLFFIIHGRLPIRVVKHGLLDKVEYEECQNRDGEENGQAEAVHEGDEADVEDGAVLVVHEVDWARVEVYVVLHGGLLCGLLVAGEAAIHQSERCTHQPVSDEFQQWVVSIKNHRANQRITNLLKKVRVKVSTRSFVKANGREWLL